MATKIARNKDPIQHEEIKELSLVSLFKELSKSGHDCSMYVS